MTREEIEAKNFDLKAVNPNAKGEEDTRTPGELLDLIEAKGREVMEALVALRQMEMSGVHEPDGFERDLGEGGTVRISEILKMSWGVAGCQG